MKVPENVLKEVNDHLATGLNILKKNISDINQDLDEKSNKVMTEVVRELKAGNKLLAEYLDKFPDK